MPKYNLALIPLSKEYNQFITYAKNLSSQIKHIDKYHLTNHTIPHVTLCHFEAEESELKTLWGKFQLLPIEKSIHLTFEILLNNTRNRLNWFMLIPNEMHALTQMHQLILTIIQHPKSLSGDDYLPHLTLFNSLNVDIKDNQQKITNTLKGRFKLAITDRDQIGQSLRVLFHEAL